MSTLKQLISRFKIIATGGASRIVISLNSVICAFVIIRWHSSSLWGELVVYLLLLDLGFSIIAWGSTPYLIREFSFHPKDIPASWSKSFNSRVPLVVIFLIVIFFTPFAPSHKITLSVWVIARFVYHSFEPVVQYQRNFYFSLFVEGIALLVLIIPLIIFSSDVNIHTLILLFTASMIWKAVASAIYFRRLIAFEWPRWNFYLLAFPFLLLTFSALFLQRSDLYGVAYYLSKQDTAKYQVFINLLIFSQFLSSLLLSPYAKNIFRLPAKSFRKLEKRFMLIGLPLSALSLVGVYVLMRWIYKLELSWQMFALGYFYIQAFYMYLLRNYHLGKIHRQTRVAIYSFIASGVNVALSLLLIPVFHLEGALMAGVATQLFLIVLYHYPITTSYASR